MITRAIMRPFGTAASCELAPAYDICPQARSNPEANQAIYIADQNRRSQVEVCRLAARKFLLRDEDARAIIDGQVAAIRDNWQAVCDAGQLEPGRSRFSVAATVSQCVCLRRICRPRARRVMSLDAAR